VVVSAGHWDFLDDIPEDAGLAVAIPAVPVPDWRWDNDRWEWVRVADSSAVDAGLSTAHKGTQNISQSAEDGLPDGWSWLPPEPEPATQTRPEPAKIEFWRGGSLVSTRHAKAGSFKQQGGGTRGKITTFSKASRRRLMQTIAKLRRNAYPTFVTLTYPAEWPSDPTEWKRHLKVFRLRLGRKFPGVCFIWRLEFQKRGAPHYHLLVWGAPYGKLLEWVSLAWYQVVDSGDEKHLRAGTRVERIRSFKQVMRYASKELGKVSQVVNEYHGVGRWWGVFGRDFLPWAVLSRLQVHDADVDRFMRWLRRFAGLPARSYKSLSVFADGSFWSGKIRAGPDPPSMGFLWWSKTVQATKAVRAISAAVY